MNRVFQLFVPVRGRAASVCADADPCMGACTRRACGLGARVRACGRDVRVRADRGLVRSFCLGLVGPHVGLAHIDRDSIRGGHTGLMGRMTIRGA